jgi:hypothetical protein
MIMRQMLCKPTRRDYPRVTYGHEPSVLDIMTPKRLQRFWSKVDQSGGGFVCHPWTGGRNRGGYGLVQGANAYRGFTFCAHVVAWAVSNQQEPEGRVVRHRCDNPSCCNPLHLLIGTDRENWLDAVARGRVRPGRIGDISRGKLGPDANAADFTHEQREKARELRYVYHLPYAAICAVIGCHRSTLTRWFAED